MMKWLRKYQYQITIALAAVMVYYIFVGLGADFFTSKPAPTEAILEVNGDKMTAQNFLSHYRRALDQAGAGKKMEPQAQAQVRDEVVRDMVQSLVFSREAERYGITVPDRQVVMSLAQEPAFQDKGRFNPQLYSQIVQSQLHMTLSDFEDEKRRMVAFYKLRWLIQSSIKLTDREFQMMAPVRVEELTKANQLKKDPKTGKVDLTQVRQQLWQEKVLYSFNQWFNQLGRTLKVKTHFELLKDQGVQ